MRLIERLEAAEAGSRELDIAVADALGLSGWPCYTTSLDRSLSLFKQVLSGWDWSVTTITTSVGGLKKVNAVVCHPNHPAGQDILSVSDAATPELALCAAILKAKETK